jgi:hypothetical protein
MKPDPLDEIGHKCVVDVRRRYGDNLVGIIAAHGRKWLLLHHVIDFEVLGLVAVRIADLTRVRPQQDDNDVTARVLNELNTFPSPVEGLKWDTTAEALTSMTSLDPVITIRPDRRWLGTCHLGQLGPFDTEFKSFSLREITTVARWEKDFTSWRLTDVRRIDAGDSYARGLQLLAGPPPQ